VTRDHLPLTWTVGFSCVTAVMTANPLWLLLVLPAVAIDLHHNRHHGREHHA